MKQFQIHSDIKYAIDVKGVAIMHNGGQSCFFEYPEAAIWLLLAKETEQQKSLKQIEAVLSGIVTNTGVFVRICIKSWREAGLIN